MRESILCGPGGLGWCCIVFPFLPLTFLLLTPTPPSQELSHQTLISGLVGFLIVLGLAYFFSTSLGTPAILPSSHPLDA